MVTDRIQKITTKIGGQRRTGDPSTVLDDLGFAMD